EQIRSKYPQSDAARQMAEKLPDLKARVKKQTEEKRLAGLWLYQMSPMAGGKQSTAVIKNSKPGDVEVRLTLRRQSSWGTSVFLYDAPDKGFVCHKLCNVVMHFDGKRHVYKGYLPDGDEPAMFIKQTRSFL